MATATAKKTALDYLTDSYNAQVSAANSGYNSALTQAKALLAQRQKDRTQAQGVEIGDSNKTIARNMLAQGMGRSTLGATEGEDAETAIRSKYAGLNAQDTSDYNNTVAGAASTRDSNLTTAKTALAQAQAAQANTDAELAYQKSRDAVADAQWKKNYDLAAKKK